MQSQQSAKEKLAESLTELLQQETLDKLTVSRITTHCGMTRQIFYRYFTDKYDLVLWIYKREYNQQLSKQNKTILYEEQFLNLLLLLRKKLDFYNKVLSSKDINSLTNFMIDQMIHDMCSIVNYATGCKADEQLLFLIRLYANTVVRELSAHLSYDTVLSAEMICSWIAEAMPVRLKDILAAALVPCDLFYLESLK